MVTIQRRQRATHSGLRKGHESTQRPNRPHRPSPTGANGLGPCWAHIDPLVACGESGERVAVASGSTAAASMASGTVMEPKQISDGGDATRGAVSTALVAEGRGGKGLGFRFGLFKSG